MVVKCAPWIMLIVRGEGRAPEIMLRSQRVSMNSETFILLFRRLRFHDLAYICHVT